MPKDQVTVSGTKEFVTFYGSMPDSSLKKKIDSAFDNLKKNPTAGEKIQARLFPAKYVRKYWIRNLFRYSLGPNYRMLYTLIGKIGMIQCVILEILSHKEYDSLFGYHTS